METGNSISIVHWNMGNRKWVNKVEDLQGMLADLKPNIAMISEANLFAEDPDFSVNIPGYSMILTHSMAVHGVQ